MKWQLAFSSERRGMLAHHAVEALTPVEALGLGRRALHAEYPRRQPAGPELFAQAQRVGGQNIDGWVLYAIVRAEDAWTGSEMR